MSLPCNLDHPHVQRGCDLMLLKLSSRFPGMWVEYNNNNFNNLQLINFKFQNPALKIIFAILSNWNR